MLLELCNVTKEYPLRFRRKPLFKPKEKVKAVNQINMTIKKGESVGIVGESGSGKSTLAKLITKIEPVTSGQILLNGRPIHGRNIKDFELYKQIQLVLQDSSTSLYPKLQVKDILAEPLQHYFPEEKLLLEESSRHLLELVGLDEFFLSRYPHQLSGGQKQRVCIAKALAVKPEMIIFDESIASLDHKSQQSIINRLKLIQKQQQLTYIFITHDLKSTQQLCDHVMVMYQGELVDTFNHQDPQTLTHPYSRLLFQTLD